MREAASAALFMGGASRAAAMPIGLIEAIETGRASAIYPVPTADGVNIDRSNDTMVARVSGKVFVFARTCPHQNTALRWVDRDHRFQCPKHGSKYTAEGVFIEGRATRSLDRFAVRKEGATVIANLDALYQETADAEKWKAAFVTV